ncbi:MAG: L-glutamate gamma-semialdehyde dehydrogenase [Deltaproteobacteria bacterium]|nr:L-glutamate gamma-semialdehyde dehydrogenase [Deltaproteobacteria bacterium]
MSPQFKNEPALDFSVEANRRKFALALESVQKHLEGGRYCAMPIISGAEIATTRSVKSIDPSEVDCILGQVQFASPDHVDQTLHVLSTEGRRWQLTPWQDRIAIIRKAASLISQRRLELAALIVREVGKPWREADADVTEAIDFCNYYSAEAELAAHPRELMQIPGENNIYFYKPRGLAAVIAPWNFPLAIACGMTVASLICGNPTILKPAEQSSLVAFKFAHILLESGVPPYAFAFLPGYGEEIGAQLVSDPRVSLICFTGSKAVGLEILKTSSQVLPNQSLIKRAIVELGGKNCIIVDEDADLDEAIKGVLYSAFGYSGQKCSACSRVVAVGAIYKPFLERLREAASDIIIGKAKDPATFVGPVIDSEAQQRINAVIERADHECVLHYKTDSLPTGGCFVAPTIYRDVSLSSSIWKEEIFGPVLACRHAASFDEALSVANDSQYALTGGLYSRSPGNIRRAYSELEAGNIYINRGCTGALVCRQPFGGYKLSGVGSKAGGPDYLLQFMEPVVVTENTMRRGFAPDQV